MDTQGKLATVKNLDGSIETMKVFRGIDGRSYIQCGVYHRFYLRLVNLPECTWIATEGY